MLAISPWQQDFAVFSVHPELIYLDSAATSLTPKCVADAVHYYQCFSHANSHKGLYKLSANATQIVDQGRTKVAGFINANSSDNIVFTSSTTEAINLVAQGFFKSQIIEKINQYGKANIVISVVEHHANFLPWQQLAQQTGAELRVVEFCPAKLSQSGQLSLSCFAELIDETTVVVAINHISNVLGTISPINELCALAHEKGALVLVDGAQAVAHIEVDVQKLQCDFYTFSAHKMYGVSGCGILYGKQSYLLQMSPLLLGGGIVEQVTQKGYHLVDNAMRLEAGSHNVASIVGLMAAIDYLEQIDRQKRQQYLHKLGGYLQQSLSALDYISPLVNNNGHGAVFSFNVNGVHSHDVASFLDGGSLLAEQSIAVRAGHHCAQPLHQFLALKSSVRVSLGLYNSKKDIDKLVQALNKVHQLLA